MIHIYYQTKKRKLKLKASRPPLLKLNQTNESLPTPWRLKMTLVLLKVLKHKFSKFLTLCEKILGIVTLRKIRGLIAVQIKPREKFLTSIFTHGKCFVKSLSNER